MSAIREPASNNTAVAGSIANSAMRSSRADGLFGRNPPKKNRSVGNLVGVSAAAQTADAPGIAMTWRPSAWAARTELVAGIRDQGGPGVGARATA